VPTHQNLRLTTSDGVRSNLKINIDTSHRGASQFSSGKWRFSSLWFPHMAQRKRIMQSIIGWWRAGFCRHRICEPLSAVCAPLLSKYYPAEKLLLVGPDISFLRKKNRDSNFIHLAQRKWSGDVLLWGRWKSKSAHLRQALNEQLFICQFINGCEMLKIIKQPPNGSKTVHYLRLASRMRSLLGSGLSDLLFLLVPWLFYTDDTYLMHVVIRIKLFNAILLQVRMPSLSALANISATRACSWIFFLSVGAHHQFVQTTRPR